MHRFRRSGGGTPVLVVDQDRDTLSTVGSLLRRAGYAVVEAQNGHEAVEAARREPPHLVVLDLDLSDSSGYEIYRELRDVFGPSLPIVLLSGRRTDPNDEVAAFLLGADDYVTKPFVPDVLLARLRRLAHPSQAAGGGLHSQLTPRELEVLKLLVEGRQEAEIARLLCITPKTVGKHIEHILGKLGVHSRAQAIALAARRGMVPERGRQFASESD